MCETDCLHLRNMVLIRSKWGGQMFMRILFTLSCMISLSACVGTGPRLDAILGDEDAQAITATSDQPYAVLTMSEASAVQATELKRNAARQSFLPNQAASAVIIGAGDTIQVTIVSTSDAGFLDIANSSINPISSTSLPAQEVAADGLISVPPIGRVRAAGNSVAGFERFLTRRLGEVLVDPTAIVQMVDRTSAQVSIVGEIAAPGTYSINQNSRHLSEAIAIAGGSTVPAEDVRVVISRGSRTGSATLADIYESPSLDLHLQAGDIIRLETLDYEFTALGAGGVNANIEFDRDDFTLANALGEAGGLLNSRADPRGVFVYRVVSRSDAVALGIDVTEFAGSSIPMIFRFNLREPESFFIAQQFEIADDDVVYISTSLLSELDNVFGIFSSIRSSSRNLE